MSQSKFTYYVIILGEWGGQGHDYLDHAGGGVQNKVKLDYVIFARPLTLSRATLKFQAIAFLQVLLDSK